MEGNTFSTTTLTSHFFATVSSLCSIQSIRELLLLLLLTETLEQFCWFFADHFLLLSHLCNICVHPDPKLGTLERDGMEESMGMTDKIAGKMIVRMGKSLNTSQDYKPIQKSWLNQGFPSQKPLRKPSWNTWFFFFLSCLFSAVPSFLEPIRARKMDPAIHYSSKDYVLCVKNFQFLRNCINPRQSRRGIYVLILLK